MKEGFNKETKTLHLHLTGENLEVEDAGIGERLIIDGKVFSITEVNIYDTEAHGNVTGRPGNQAVTFELE